MEDYARLYIYLRVASGGGGGPLGRLGLGLVLLPPQFLQLLPLHLLLYSNESPIRSTQSLAGRNAKRSHPTTHNQSVSTQ